MGDVLDIKARPEIRFFATWMNWDKALDRYAINDDFGGKGFAAGGTWNFGVQHGDLVLIKRPVRLEMPGRVDLNTRCYFVTMPVLYEVI